MPRRAVVYPKEILNDLKWSGSQSLEGVEIHYVHRGCPGDTKVISGRDIRELGKSFFRTDESEIPYHRIRKIIRNGVVLYDSGRYSKIKEVE